ncbi:NUDIX hydrolase [Paenibacillus sp. NPDC058174]|uniref:NUDIX hydrolase n=1 Tax=Paenibacillus sp. NPDC058174 TaxID=3346366 RepID=UPI0036D8D416
MGELWHRHLGVYGICIRNNSILLVHKQGGPYENRYDLPGGTVEPNESLLDALHREFEEETGISIKVVQNLGTRDYVIPYRLEKRGTTHIHHIAVYYEVEYLSGELTYCTDMQNNDSSGSEWIDVHSLSSENSSPLVIHAVAWMKDMNQQSFEVARLNNWTAK